VHFKGKLACASPSSFSTTHSTDEKMESLAVFFGCPQCSAVYEAMQRKLEGPGSGSFACRNCGTVVHRWSEARSYTDWRIFDPVSGTVAGSR
jgi:predicted RNA-binding Zn-ribbon protein involved in translation (DUF1610 family)